MEMLLAEDGYSLQRLSYSQLFTGQFVLKQNNGDSVGI
jgi:hypothetical protein